MNRRRLLVGSAVFVLLLAITASRCDRRGPGEAAVIGPDETIDGGVVRRDLRFPCGESTCAGWMYLPEAGSEPPPVVVMGHGFAGTRDVGLPPIAERLAREGLAVFVFDYRSFGASGGTPRQLVDPWQELDDWRAAIAFVRARPEVDGARLALFGASLGGGHALTIAAETPDVRAVVAQAPMIDTGVEGEATFYGVPWVVRLLFSAWADFLGSAWGREPLTLAAIAPAGEFGMIVDDHAYAAFEKLVGPESTYRNVAAARSIFLFDDYDPASHVDAIKAPVLVVASPSDRFVPFSAVQAYAARAPNVTVETFEGDHFDVYSPPASTKAADVAARFLADRLSASQPLSR
ncbi:MAG: alpha/beta hydrolase [Deltaproteobacteria bacterium]|nr:alpha/beta hydrolase [Deltaproteobacteria bacterium]